MMSTIDVVEDVEVVSGDCVVESGASGRSWHPPKSPGAQRSDGHSVSGKELQGRGSPFSTQVPKPENSPS